MVVVHGDDFKPLAWSPQQISDEMNIQPEEAGREMNSPTIELSATSSWTTMRKMVDEYIALIFEDGEIAVLAG